MPAPVRVNPPSPGWWLGRGALAWLLGLVCVIPALEQGATTSLLGADGVVLRDRQGQGAVVRLRGVNLGAWLKWEAWMSPIDRAKNVSERNPGHNGFEFDVRALLSRRFGAATAHELMTTYKDHWITERDLDLIQAQGLNAVRLPLSYDHLLAEDGAWRDDAFRHVDWLIAQAWKRGIWTILDYHGYLPPCADHDGSAGGYWGAEAMQLETIRIWSAIAERYRGNPGVAMYDLINEPTNSTPTGGRQPNSYQVCQLYDRLYRAIRAADPDHLIAMEGMWDWRTLRDPLESGYRNVVYSYHWYHWQAKSTEQHRSATTRNLHEIQEQWERWKVPVYIGEFNHFGDPEAWRDGIADYDGAGLSWTMWSWKNQASGSNSWGLLTSVPGKAPPVPDLAKDSAEDIRAAWTAWETGDRTFALNPMLAPILRASSTGVPAAPTINRQ